MNSIYQASWIDKFPNSIFFSDKMEEINAQYTIHWNGTTANDNN